MSIEVQTADSTALVKRTISLFDFDVAYTLLFNIYLPSSNPTSDIAWFMSGSSGYSSATQRGTFYDQLRWTSGNDLNAECVDGGGTQFMTPIITTAFSSGWNRVAIIRTGLTTIKIRANGETSSLVTNASFTAREATALEGLFTGAGGVGQPCPVGTRITNYKAWTAALSYSEIDAEHLTTTVIVTSNFYSQSPMGDEQTLSANLTQIGSSTTWTAGAGVVAGLNDPAVAYGAGTIGLSGSVSASALGSMPLNIAIPL